MKNCKNCDQPFKPTNQSKGFCSVRCRFLNKVDRTPGHGPTGTCWEWTAKRHRFGHGAIRVSGKWVQAHSLSYNLFIGENYNKRYVLHRCDNPGCVNPNHLFLGTQNENIEDMVKKRRQAIGERIGTSKLTRAQVNDLRRLRSEGMKQQELADMFGIGQAQVSNIVNQKVWK